MILIVALVTACMNENRCSAAVSVSFVNLMAQKQKDSYKIKAIEEAETQSKEAAVLLIRFCMCHVARSQHGTA